MSEDIPQFLLDLLLEQYGNQITSSIIDGYTKKRKVTLRANTLKVNINDIKDFFNSLNITYSTIPWYTDALILDNISEKELQNLEIYKNGEIYLQSLSSMLPAIILSPKENENILDMTAAPGGKATQILALSDNKSYITACEKNKIRFERLKYNINKLGANKVNALQIDSRNLDDFLSFDKILLDAPCSGSGTLQLDNKNLKDNFTEDLINRSSKIQMTLLDKAIRILKPNHELIYSTCSILYKENEHIIKHFLDKKKVQIVPINIEDFSAIPILPVSIPGTLCVRPTELYEGFFVAKLVKL